MENEDMEAAITRTLIERGSELSRDGKNEDGGENGMLQTGVSSSSTTFLVVLSTFVAVCGSFVFGNAVGYSSPAEAGIVNELGLTTAQYSVFGSLLTIGGMLGAVISGTVADIIGRKGAMGLSEVFCILGWLAIFFAKDCIWLDVGRFSLGCGIGLLSYVVPVYVAEITAKNVRGAFTSLNQLMLGVGKAVTFLIGSLVEWRTLAIIGLVPCLVQLIGLFIIPESPRWLAKVGRLKEFESSLQRLRGKNVDTSLEADSIKDHTKYLQGISKDGILSLFQSKFAYSITVAVGVMLFQQLGGLSAFSFYTSEIFVSAGFSSTIGTISAAVVQILMSALGVILIDRSGRRPLLLISATGACLGCVITAFSFFTKDLSLWKHLTPALALIGVLVYLGSVELGLGGIPWIIMSEIFPINVKGAAGSLVSLVNWLSSWVVSYTFNILFDWSSAGTFLTFAVISGAGVFFIAKLVPETKGCTLEEIQDSITSNSR